MITLALIKQTFLFNKNFYVRLGKKRTRDFKLLEKE